MCPARVDLPDRIEVLVTSEDENGKVYDRATFDARLRDDGGFVVTRKWKKNVDAETTMSVFVTPIGGDLPKGLDVDLCVRVAKQKNTLSRVADCAPGSFDLPAAFELELDSVGFHELISVEGAFPQDLGATDGRELVVALRDVSRPRQTCPRDDVPWDGCASVDWDDVDGKRNAPPGGGYFENKLVIQTEDGKRELFLNRALGISPEIDDDFELG